MTIFYTAPTAIRAFMRWGDAHPRSHRLDTLRLLGTVGEPINPAAWVWYHETIGRGRCPIVDTWWQTETGGVMVAPLPGPPSQSLALVRSRCRELRSKWCTKTAVAAAKRRRLPVLTRSWPGQLRTVYGDPERYRKPILATSKSMAVRCISPAMGRCFDEDGYLWVMGRVDDVLNVSGHRIGTAEVESALVGHPHVAEAAVVGRPDDIRGQAIVAFVTLRGGHAGSEQMAGILKRARRARNRCDCPARGDSLHRRATEDAIGKIMRRLLREIATTGRAMGDVTTLEDMAVLQRLSASDSDEE